MNSTRHTTAPWTKRQKIATYCTVQMSCPLHVHVSIKCIDFIQVVTFVDTRYACLFPECDVVITIVNEISIIYSYITYMNIRRWRNTTSQVATVFTCIMTWLWYQFNPTTKGSNSLELAKRYGCNGEWVEYGVVMSGKHRNIHCYHQSSTLTVRTLFQYGSKCTCSRGWGLL